MLRIIGIMLIGLFSNHLAMADTKEFFGMASWYGDQFNGKQTANGEIYDMQEMTVAHKTLPFGTILKVTNLKNNKSVVVRVNDRGPFVKDRVLDLSKKAALSLDAHDEGVINVKATILKVGDGKRYHNDPEGLKQVKLATENLANDYNDQSEIDSELNQELGESATTTPKLPTSKVEYEDKAIDKVKTEALDVKKEESQDYKVNRIFVIQFAAFSDQQKAEAYQEELYKAGVTTYIAQEGVKDRALFKVRERKTYRDIEEVLQNVVRFKKMGLEAFAIGKFFIPDSNK